MPEGGSGPRAELERGPDGAPRLTIRDGRTRYLHSDALLQSMGSEGPMGELALRESWNDGEAFVVEAGGDGFEARASFVPAGDQCPYLEVELELRYLGESQREAGLRIVFSLEGDTLPEGPRPLIPAAFYGRNRPDGCRRVYPRFDSSAEGPAGREAADPNEMVSDHWALRADRSSLPAVFCWSGDGCAALAIEEESPIGLNGLGFSGGPDGTRLWLDMPYREEPLTFTGHPPAGPPDIRLHAWAPGEAATLRFQVYLGGADAHAYDPLLRELYARRGSEGHSVRPGVALADAASATADALMRWHYRADPPILLETIAFDRENAAGTDMDRGAMHVSWISGIPHAHALLTYARAEGRAHGVEAAIAVIDHICVNLTPSGFFWGEYRLDKGWRAGWNADPRRLHARTMAEAALFLGRALRSEREAGQAHPEWEAALRSNLDAALRAQDSEGDLGMYYDIDTGEAVDRSSAAGILWIAALVEAAELLGEPAYRDAAVRAGDAYARYVDDQFINGAPEDVHTAPTSEDGYNAVIAYVALVESEPDTDQHARWLRLARWSADWMLTWRWSYNVRFGERTLLGRYGFATRGGDGASSAIQILHPYGLICLPEMIRLWRLTGDDHYLERTRDNLACFLQLVPLQDGDVNAWRGMITERYYHTNAFQAKGMMLALSHAWCTGLTLYACQAAAADSDAFGSLLATPTPVQEAL